MKEWLAVAAWLLAAGAHAAPPERVATRVVTLGGSETEIVYQLGQGGKLVGDDLSSLNPEAATKLPRVGYYRAVPVVGVLALKPGEKALFWIRLAAKGRAGLGSRLQADTAVTRLA